MTLMSESKNFMNIMVMSLLQDVGN